MNISVQDLISIQPGTWDRINSRADALFQFVGGFQTYCSFHVEFERCFDEWSTNLTVVYQFHILNEVLHRQVEGWNVERSREAQVVHVDWQ